MPSSDAGKPFCKGKGTLLINVSVYLHDIKTSELRARSKEHSRESCFPCPHMVCMGHCSQEGHGSILP